MKVYIVQNEKDEICYVSIDPIDVLEEIERMGKTTLTVGIWPLGDLQKIKGAVDENTGIKTVDWQPFHSPNPSNSNHKVSPEATTSCEVNKDFLTETKSTEL